MAYKFSTEVPTDELLTLDAHWLHDAAHSFGIDITEDQHNRWVSWLDSWQHLKSILESEASPAQRLLRFDATVNGQPSAHGHHSLTEFTNGLNTDQFFVFSTIANELRNISEDKRRLTSARALGASALSEGRYVGHYLKLPYERFGATDNFNRWVPSFVAAVLAVNTSMELPRRYQDGLTRVQPNGLNRSIVLAVGMPTIFKAGFQVTSRRWRQSVEN